MNCTSLSKHRQGKEREKDRKKERDRGEMKKDKNSEKFVRGVEGEAASYLHMS